MLNTIINNIYTVRASGTDLFPPHEIRDRQHLESIASSMTINGWQGAPLVQYGGQLLTGSHRLVAAKQVAVDNYTFEIPVVDLDDVFIFNEDDLAEAMQLDNWIEEVTRMARQSNPELAIALGLDADN